MNRTRGLAVAVAAGIAIAGLLGGCTSKPSSSAQSTGQDQTERAFAQQQAAVPYPADQLKDSLERRNLVERLLRTNQPNKIGYVYLLSFSGQPLGYYTIKGKVSSTQSQLTTDQLVYRFCRNGNCSDNVVSAPGDDGSYGLNEDGVFFFTTENAYVTTDLNYLYSDQPLPLNVPLLNKK